MKSHTGKIIWPPVLAAGIALGLSVIALEYVVFLRELDYAPFTGIVKQVAKSFLLPAALFVFVIIRIIRLKGATNVVQTMAHCVLVALIGGLLASPYYYWFYQNHSDYYEKVQAKMVEMQKKQAEEITDLEMKSAKLQEIRTLEKTMEAGRSQDVTYWSVFQRTTTGFIIPALLFGFIFGLIFRTISAGGAEVAPKATEEDREKDYARKKNQKPKDS